MSRPTFVVTALGLASVLSLSAPLHAAEFTEKGQKIALLRDSGSGEDKKSAAIKLDTAESLAAQCIEDIIIFDAKTDAGKKIYQELAAIQKSKAPLKSITFTKDEEGDCKLVKFEK